MPTATADLQTGPKNSEQTYCWFLWRRRRITFFLALLCEQGSQGAENMSKSSFGGGVIDGLA